MESLTSTARGSNYMHGTSIWPAAMQMTANGSLTSLPGKATRSGCALGVRGHPRHSSIGGRMTSRLRAASYLIVEQRWVGRVYSLSHSAIKIMRHQGLGFNDGWAELPHTGRPPVPTVQSAVHIQRCVRYMAVNNKNLTYTTSTTPTPRRRGLNTPRPFKAASAVTRTSWADG